MTKNHFIFLVTLILSFPFAGKSQVINTDSSQVAFKISNLGINTVEGRIKGFDGTILLDSLDISNSFFRVCIDPATVNTGIAARDRALLEGEYFDVESYPRICFFSGSILKTEEGLVANGKLTLKGISREMSIPFFIEGKTITGSLEIDRSDFGVGPKGGFLVGKTVTISIICVLETSIP